MSFQERPNAKSTNKKIVSNDSHDQPKNSLLINSSFSIGNQERKVNKQITEEVLKKVSQTIVSLHSTLVPKTQNIEIYRDLTEQQQNMLKLVQDSPLIHTILAGVLAIDSCLKYIHRQETYVISSLMKGVTICLGNYKKVEEEFLAGSQRKISQNFLKFYDSLKLIVSDIHKIPAAKIKRNELEKHNEFVSKSQMNVELLNSLNREENLLFSLMAQENNSLRSKINQLEKELSEMEKEKVELLKDLRNADSEKKKRDSQQNLTQTGSQSAKGIADDILIKQLREQIMQKSDIIVKMNDQFAVEIEKYQKIFKRLEEQNKLLKKYNDLDTVYILQELEYEVEMLRQEKRNNQGIINQIMSQMNSITWNRNDIDYSTQSFANKDPKPRFDPRSNPMQQLRNQRGAFQMRRSRCPSVSPTNKQENLIGRYFSPNYEIREQPGRNVPRNMKGYERRESHIKRDDSPRFGNLPEEKSYESIKQRVAMMNLRSDQYPQDMLGRREFGPQVSQMRRSQTKLGPPKISGLNQPGFDLHKLKKQMRRSKFINEQMSYI